MGKIRVRTLGDEKKEKQEKKKAQLRTEAKKPQDEIKSGERTEKEVKVEKTEAVEENSKKVKKAKKKFEKKQKRSANYISIAKTIDKNKKYSLKEALEVLPKLQLSKFDETVELHINTMEKGVSGSVTLPHGTGKQIRIEIADQTEDPKHVEEIVKKIDAGKIDFDVLIATPDAMPKLARVAKFLGPRGLMPNPKSGTVTPKPKEVAKKYQGGQVNFKTEVKFPILHLIVGKMSFGDKKLNENITATINAVQSQNIKNITLKSTMSPGIKIEL